jgi:hypothetical protein
MRRGFGRQMQVESSKSHFYGGSRGAFHPTVGQESYVGNGFKRFPTMYVAISLFVTFLYGYIVLHWSVLPALYSFTSRIASS